MTPDARTPQTDREWLIQIADDVSELKLDVHDLKSAVARQEKTRDLIIGLKDFVMVLVPLGIGVLAFGIARAIGWS